MTRTLIVAVAMIFASQAWSETYSYDCRLNGKSLKVKIDDVKNTLIWKGKIYKIRVEESCAKFGWHAERKGESFDFCTATKGYADFEEGGKTIQCDQDR